MSNKYTTVRLDRKLAGRVKSYAHERGITITEAATQLATLGLAHPEAPDADPVPPVLRALPSVPEEPSPRGLGEVLAAAELLSETLRTLSNEAGIKRPSGFRRKVAT